MSYRIKGLPAEHFDQLFALSNAELAKHGCVRRIAAHVVGRLHAQVLVVQQ
jgi:hypothetical protein